ncbi:MAG TPA: hypothetical protein VK716_05075 [Terracidiphilus sp.]|jgi:hypothetical protein|nr:hypothetical protein [Terracidiphilus sp.]
MPQQSPNFKGNVRPPIEMPDHVLQRPKNVAAKVEVPLMIQIFAWYCVVRTVCFLTFALIVGIAPDSPTAASVIEHFDRFPRSMPPEGIFYIFTFLYGMTAYRWFRRDWKARWITMFVTGAGAAQTLVNVIANRMAGNPDGLPPGAEGMLIVGCLFNLLICCYLAFYPGMDQAFDESDDGPFGTFGRL